MSGNIVVLTATITPRSGQKNLAIGNPLDRLSDYQKAISFYQSLLDSGAIKGLVFAENSGHDLATLQRLFPDPRIEWLSTYDLNYPSRYHRGYGEFRLIDYAMKNSSTVAGLAVDEVVWKVTGRYIIENLHNVIRFAPKRFDLYCASNGSWTEMSVMAWTRHGHAGLLLGAWELFATGMAPEPILASRLACLNRTEYRIVNVFSWPPLIVGRRGTDGGQFTGWLSRWKFRAKLLPKLLRIPFR